MAVLNKSWDNFKKHTLNTFSNFRDNAEFSDDGKKYKAHRLVISASASSTVFQEILADSSFPAAVIFLRGVDRSKIKIVT